LATGKFLEHNEGKSDSDTDEDSGLGGNMESFVNPFCPLQSQPTSTDILLGLGHISKLYIDLPNENNPEGTATFIPTSLLYLYRGSELHELNYYEYLGIVQFENKPPRMNPNSPKKNLLKHFSLNQDFIAVLTSHHSLKTKQSTPLLTGPQPRHPGNPPADMNSSKMSKWHERANYYAKYYLSLFRPESIKSNLRYTWTDLQEFVDSLQHDNSIISKFRLMIMETHMQGLKTTEHIKKMTL
jgi:hypothetical protein